MTGRRVWPMDLLERPKPVEAVAHEAAAAPASNLGPTVKPLSLEVPHESVAIPEVLDLKFVATQKREKPQDLFQALDEFSITLKGSHCVYGVLGLIIVVLGLYLWHLNARIQGLEALIMVGHA